MTGELILVIEDFDLLREGMREVLLQAGYNVIAARDGMEALEQMNSLIPELIISDITMPRMDGFEFFKTVRTRPEWVTIPFIFLSARQSSQDVTTGRNLGADDYLTKPIHWDELITTVQARLGRFHQTQMARVQQAYLDSLITLANAIEKRSPGSHNHIQRVADLALAMARRMGWSDRQSEALRFAAILHDIGKIHIPSAILFKPGPLTDEEWELVRRHPVTGAEMIKDVPYLLGCIPYVRHHHEKWDGTGYPDRLAQEAIPEGARILAVADAYDAMRTPRLYAPQRSPEQAMTDIVRQSGMQFDPQVVSAFQAAWMEQEPALFSQ